MSLTRDRLRAAMASLAAQRGLRRVSLRDVARKAGVTTGAVYSCFRGKDELVAAVIDEVVPHLSVHLAPSLQLRASVELSAPTQLGAAAQLLLAAADDAALRKTASRGLDGLESQLADALDCPDGTPLLLALLVGMDAFAAIRRPLPDEDAWTALRDCLDAYVQSR